MNNDAAVMVVAGGFKKTQPADRNSDAWNTWAMMLLEVCDGLGSVFPDFNRAQFMDDCR